MKMKEKGVASEVVSDGRGKSYQRSVVSFYACSRECVSGLQGRKDTAKEMGMKQSTMKKPSLRKTESESTSEKENPRCDMNGEQRKQDFIVLVKGYEFFEEAEAKQAPSIESFVVCDSEDDEESGGTEYFATTPEKTPKKKRGKLKDNRHV